MRNISTTTIPPAPKPLFEPGTDIFRWGPIPGRYYYIADFIEAVLKRFSSVHGEPFPKTNLLFGDSSMVWLIRNHLFRSFCVRMFKDIALDDEKRQELNKRWEQSLAELEKVEHEIEEFIFEEADKKHLFGLAERLEEAAENFWLPTFPGEFGNYGSEAVLKDLLSKYINSEREIGKAMERLTAPEELSFLQRSEVELLKTKDLSKYVERYHWLDNSYVGVKVLGAEDFLDRKEKLDANLEEKLESRLTEVKERKSGVISKFGLSEEITRVAKVIVELVIQQDARKMHMQKLQYYKERLLEALAVKAEVDIELLRNCSLIEIVEGIKGDGLRGLAEERQQPFDVRGINSAVEIIHGEKVAHYWRHYSSEKLDDEFNTLSGVVASRGFAIRSTGKVRVVLDPHKAKDFEDGEILVATMTSPDFVHLMRKAGGVVTDAGGLTSHAAILSRELNLPCIVGTKTATKLLKDGDVVELDTHAGIVRLVK